MKFEEALSLMREGKKVKRPVQFVPRTMKDGRIVEVYKDKDEKLKYEPLDSMNTCNIIAGDWEVVDDNE